MYIAELITPSGIILVYREMPITRLVNHVLNVGHAIKNTFKESTVDIRGDCVILTLYKEPLSKVEQDWNATSILITGSGFTEAIGRSLLEEDLPEFVTFEGSFKFDEVASTGDSCVFVRLGETNETT